MSHDAALTRRTLLAAGAATAGVVAVAGCGSGNGSAASTTPTGGTGSTGGTGGTGGTAPLIAVADVPVGGAASATDAEGNPLIVSQPKAGQIVAFSAVCTHRGCTVAPDGAQLRCPCHGSVYDAFTGDVVSGPAPDPLPEVSVDVKQGEVLPA